MVRDRKGGATPLPHRDEFLAIVRGPLGIGKTTVAKALAAKWEARYISVDAILEDFDLEIWEEGYISEAAFLRSNVHVAVQAARWLGNGRAVVVDGNFYWKSQVEDLLRRVPVRSAVFTLQAPIEVCLERDAHRGRPLGTPSVRDVYAKVVSFDCGIPVDATRPVETIVADLSARLRGLAGPPRGSVTSRAARARRPRG
jgi:predicted kinase